jgi:hypothetical protein
MVEIVSCLRSAAMTFAKKIDGRIGEKTVASIEEKIVEKIAGTIGGSSAARIDKSSAAKIDEIQHDQMQAASCGGLTGPIMSPATMDGMGGILPVLLRWIGQTDRSESNDQRKSKGRNDRTVRRGRKRLSDLNGQTVPSGRKNRSERGETDENRLWKSYADRLFRGGMPSFGILPDLLCGTGFSLKPSRRSVMVCVRHS